MNNYTVIYFHVPFVTKSKSNKNKSYAAKNFCPSRTVAFLPLNFRGNQQRHLHKIFTMLSSVLPDCFFAFQRHTVYQYVIFV